MPKDGVVVAMLTPFDLNGAINEEEVCKIVDFLISKRVNGIFVLSSNGEQIHLSDTEKLRVIDVVCDHAGGRVDILVGAAASCYEKSIQLASYAKRKNCSAAVVSGQYFFKNSPEVVESHIATVASRVDIPIVLYNIPAFSGEISRPLRPDCAVFQT